MKSLLRIAFLSLVMGVVLSFNAPTHAQETGNPPVDGMPVPPGGFNNFSNSLNQTIRKAALEAKVEGVLLVSYVVTAEGKVENVKVIRSLCPSCDEEAVRVISNSGIWTPSKKEGKPIVKKMTLQIGPVQF
ncbi:MAG: energy transducer TonB [Bacteroidota bacterium]|jgi:TonB family protein